MTETSDHLRPVATILSLSPKITRVVAPAHIKPSLVRCSMRLYLLCGDKLVPGESNPHEALVAVLS